MQIILKTEVKGNFKDVIRRFDRELFEALKPTHAEIEIVEFTGCRTDDRVHLKFHSPLKAEWVSLITDDGENDHEAYFVDEGEKLPFPLSYWKHRHIVRKLTADSSIIIDDITFKAHNFLLTAMLYPAIYMSFAPRKKIYRQYFAK